MSYQVNKDSLIGEVLDYDKETAEFFFETMKMPANLRAVGITEKTHFDVMAEKAADGCEGSFIPLKKEDVMEIYERAF